VDRPHELAQHARANGCFREIHDAIFRAYLEGGQDIGRVDILVELARKGGLEPMEAKAVLDVDRFRDEVEAKRAEGLGAGVTRPPTLLAGGESLEGYPDAGALEQFLTAFLCDKQP
jgi:predicted DsbA family dithiol-disulfide isomerase